MSAVNPENIIESEVPGSFEFLARATLRSRRRWMGSSHRHLIKGDTLHFEVIAESVTKGLMDVGLSTGLPVIFGVLTVNTEEQAKDRSTGANNHGLQWGKAAVEMALLRASALGGRSKKNFFGFGGDDEPAPGAKPAEKIGF